MPTAKEIHLELLEEHRRDIEGIPAKIARAEDELRHERILRSWSLTDQIDRATAIKKYLKPILDAHQQYSRAFPGHAFVSEAVTRLVCQRHGLSVSHISYYRGDVPPAILPMLERASGLAKTEYAEESEWYETYQRSRWPWPFNIRRPRWRNVRTDTVRSAWKTPANLPRLNVYVLGPISEVCRTLMVGTHGGEYNQDCHALCLKVEHGYIMLCGWDKDGNDTGVFNIQKP